jgi:hypothetical protein
MTPRTGFRRFVFCWANIGRACYRHIRLVDRDSRFRASFWFALATVSFPFLYLFVPEARRDAEPMIVDSLALHD